MMDRREESAFNQKGKNVLTPVKGGMSLLTEKKGKTRVWGEKEKKKREGGDLDGG